MCDLPRGSRSIEGMPCICGVHRPPVNTKGHGVDPDRELEQVRVYRSEPDAQRSRSGQAACQRQVHFWAAQARVVPCARPLHYRATTWYEAGRSRVMALDEGWGSRLNIPGKNLWCHWLDHTDFDHVCDDTDYTREVDGVYG